MSRLTLRLPETLHRKLETLAEHEQVSLNQYIMYALTRQVTVAYTVTPLPKKTIAQQKTAFAALLQTLGQTDWDEINKVMTAREEIEPEEGLTSEIAEAINRRISQLQSSG